MITLVFSGFSLVLHLAHHIAKFRRSCCKSFAAKCTFKVKVHCAVSSANWDSAFCLWCGVGRSLTQIRKSNGFRTEPCGTPQEKRLQKHLEDNGFFSKYQSGFRKSKSTNDHLFRLSQTIMESFNRGEHVIAAFLDVEKAFDNVWHNGLRYKIYQLDLPTKLCRWFSDFLVGRVI